MEHTKIILNKEWDRSQDLIIFDEIHKMNHWKSWLKGVFDVEGVRPRIMVTGSARLETFTNVGDSLAGRFFAYRLHPFDLKELKTSGNQENPKQSIDRLLNYSGFPEPFLENNQRFYNRWEKSHIDVILREDFLSLISVKDISKLRLLIELMRSRVGSPCSYSSLAEDLQTSYKTVKSWIELLERLYIVFRVTPYSKNIARSILKEPKYYFFNSALVKGDEGTKFENLVANALLKEIHYQHDVEGRNGSLHYLRNKSGAEIDFVTDIEGFKTLVEVKNKDASISKNFARFASSFRKVQQVQLVRNLSHEKSNRDGVFVKKAEDWLQSVPIAT